MLNQKQENKLIQERNQLNSTVKILKNFIQTARDNGSPQSRVLWKQLEKELWKQFRIKLKPSKLMRDPNKNKRVWS